MALGLHLGFGSAGIGADGKRWGLLAGPRLYHCSYRQLPKVLMQARKVTFEVGHDDLDCLSRGDIIRKAEPIPWGK